MEVYEVRKNCNDGHWAAGISCSISPPNCLATVFQGLSFEIKSLVDWRLRFGEIELVPFDKTAEKWALSSTSFVPSLPFLHPPLLSLLLSLPLSLSHWPPPQPFPTRMITLLSTAWCIQFTRLFSVISVNWILSITYRCFHICIKVRVVKSVKLQFRQCHSNKYTGLFLSPPSPGSAEVGIYGFCLNLNRSVFLGCAGSHIHVNMNMKMTGWLSDMGYLFNNLRSCTCVIICVCVYLSTQLPSWQVCDTDSMWASLSSTEALSKHFLLLPYSLSSASNIQPTTSCENVGPRWEE